MKNLLVFMSISLFFACGGSKKVVQEPRNTIISENNAPVKSDSTEITLSIKEKTPETPVEETKPTENKETIPNQTTQMVEAAKVVSEPMTHQSWNSLLGKHVSKDGIVSYKGFQQDRVMFESYLAELSENVPKNDWTKEDKLAYWINVYNAFTIKLITDNYPIKSIKDIKDPWDLRFFKLGKKWYTLNDIEHRILRKMEDPRIHFGINCASFSCPPLLNKAFTSQNVDQELDKLAISFINDTKRNTISAEKVELSKIFSWFGKDFKKEGSLIDFLNKYSTIIINSNAKKSFKTYDWSLNE